LKILKLLGVVCLVLSLQACSVTTAVKTAVEEGALVNDQIVLAGETTLCRVVSIGAWIRRYGNNPRKAQAWRALCYPYITELP